MVFAQATETVKAVDQLLSEGTWGVICGLLVLAIIGLGGVIAKLYSDLKAAKGDEATAKNEQITRLERIIPAVEKNTHLMDQVAARLERNKDDDTLLLSELASAKKGIESNREEIREVKADVRTLLQRRG